MDTDTDTPPPEDPFASMDPEMAAHPQPLFKMLRESLPVIPVEGRGVALTRRADVEEVFRHPEVFSSNADAVDLPVFACHDGYLATACISVSAGGARDCGEYPAQSAPQCLRHCSYKRSGRSGGR